VTINGRTFSRLYVAATRTMTGTSAEGRQIVSVLDSQGRVIQQTLAPGLAPITVTYDSQGRLVENRQGSQVWTYTYDERHRLIARTDAANQQIKFAYDDADRIIQRRMPSGATVEYRYDAKGNRTAIILPNSASHTLEYTPVDLDASYTPPNGGSHQRTYNLDRQVTEISFPGGGIRSQSYDTSGRLTGLSDMSGLTTFGYANADPTERVATIGHIPVAGPLQMLAYSYNGPFITAMNATGVSPAQVSYSYNANFFMTTMNLASGANGIWTAVTRDGDGLLTGFGPFTFTPGGPGGALSQISDGSLSVLYGYDSLARIITRTHQVNGQTLYGMQLGYDTTGQIVSKTEMLSGTQISYAYTYDVDGQLLAVARNGNSSESYDYDLNGNQTSQRLGDGLIETASYDEQDRLVQLGGVAYQFSADGFLAQRGSDTFTYSLRGQLQQAVVNGNTIRYGYDGLGRRVSRNDSTGTAQYIYGDPSSHLVTAVRSPAGIFTALYYDTAGLLFNLERAGVRYFVATDQAGTPRMVSTSTGTIVKVVEYNSFGRLVNDSNPTFDLPIGYAGGLADGATGLVHFQARDYEPWSGRWTARDPILFAGGQANLYLYVGNSPIQYRDPSGHFCISVSLYEGIGGGVQSCFTSEGASVCGEVGFGMGGGAGVDSGGLAKDGGTIGIEVGAKCGPVGFSSDISLDTDGCLKGKFTLPIGPVKLSDGKIGVKLDAAGEIPKAKIDANCSATGKLYGKFCHQEKW
jgi:RHS repeat-associated protein